MKQLVLALAGAAALGVAVPANAQTFYVDSYRDGYARGGAYWDYDYGYRDRGPRAEVVVRSPRARTYVYEDAPRYRYRGYSRDWDAGYSAYAYSEGPYLGYRPYRGWGDPYAGAPFVRFGGWSDW
jgi:hypothetical protein